MENRMFQPIEIVEKDSENHQMYDINECLEWTNKITLSLMVRASSIDELKERAMKAIYSMTVAQNNRKAAERAKEEALAELMAKDTVNELIEVALKAKRDAEMAVNTAEVLTQCGEDSHFNRKEEEADGR